MQRYIKVLKTRAFWIEWAKVVAFVLFLAVFFFVLIPAILTSYSPQDLTLDAEGNVYVADSGQAKIQKYDREGNLLTSYGKTGVGDGLFRQFYGPKGIAIDTQGSIYVGDWNRSVIQKFDRQGQFVSRFTLIVDSLDSSDAEGKLALDTQNNLYVVSPVSPFVQKFDSTGKVLAYWRNNDPPGNQLEKPTKIAIDAQDNIFIIDKSGLKKLDTNGHLISNVSLPEKTLVPYGLTTDPQGNLFIFYHRRIQKIDPQGTVLKEWYIENTAIIDRFIKGMVVDASNIFVLTYDDNRTRILRYDLQGHLEKEWTNGLAFLQRMAIQLTLPFWSLFAGGFFRRYATASKSKRKPPSNASTVGAIGVYRDRLNLKQLEQTLAGKAERPTLISCAVIAALFLFFPIVVILAFIVAPSNRLLMLSIVAGFVVLILIGFFVVVRSQSKNRKLDTAQMEKANTAVERELNNLGYGSEPTRFRFPFGSLFAVITAALLIFLVPDVITKIGTGTINFFTVLLKGWPAWARESILVTLTVSTAWLLITVTSVIVETLRGDKSGLKSNDWLTLLLTALGWVGLCTLVRLIIFYALQPFDIPEGSSGANFLILAIWGACYFLFLNGLITVVPAFWIKNRLNQADYTRAIRRTEFLVRLRPNSVTYRTLYSLVLLTAGNVKAAEEPVLRGLELSQAKSFSEQAQALAVVGMWRAARGEYGEAVRTIEQALELSPKITGYQAMAEAYLQQGVARGRALEIIDFWLKARRRSFVTRVLEPEAWGEGLAIRAWALAAIGQTAEAEQTLIEAFRVVGQRSRPALAEVHYKAGRIEQLLGNHDNARGEFNLAIQTDPEGYSGNRARQALANPN